MVIVYKTWDPFQYRIKQHMISQNLLRRETSGYNFAMALKLGRYAATKKATKFESDMSMSDLSFYEISW